MLNLDNFYKARYVLSKIIRKTELVKAPKIRTDCEVYLKPENLQETGSFKIRGAYYKISQLSEEEKAKVSLPALPAIMPKVSPLVRQPTASVQSSVFLRAHQ